MSFAFQDIARSIRAEGAITARDTLALRQWNWADGKVSADEAGALFDLNDLGKSRSPEWIDCFVEAIAEYAVNGTKPHGYVSDENAAWLIGRIDKDGRVETLGELELIARILEKATNAPDSLKAYAVAQIEKTVLTGEGPTRDGSALRPATVDAAEVALLRRILFAQGGDGPAAISRTEAELLFRIKDATLLHNNAPGWQTLFVQAVGHHLMAHNSYTPLTRERAAQLDLFMNDSSSSLGRFMWRMMKPGARTGLSALFAKKPGVDHDATVAADSEVTAPESAWLKAQINADAELDPIEKALLAFVAEEGGHGPV